MKLGTVNKVLSKLGVVLVFGIDEADDMASRFWIERLSSYKKRGVPPMASTSGWFLISKDAYNRLMDKLARKSPE